jgi:hypothetical protein
MHVMVSLRRTVAAMLYKATGFAGAVRERNPAWASAIGEADRRRQIKYRHAG